MLTKASAELATNGYTIVPGVLGARDVTEAVERLWAARAESERRGLRTFVPGLDPNASNVRVFNLLDLDPLFRTLIASPAGRSCRAISPNDSNPSSHRRAPSLRWRAGCGTHRARMSRPTKIARCCSATTRDRSCGHSGTIRSRCAPRCRPSCRPPCGTDSASTWRSTSAASDRAVPQCARPGYRRTHVSEHHHAAWPRAECHPGRDRGGGTPVRAEGERRASTIGHNDRCDRTSHPVGHRGHGNTAGRTPSSSATAVHIASLTAYRGPAPSG